MISGFASATRVPSRSFSFQSVQKPGLYSALKFTHNTIDVCSKQGKHKTVRRRGDGDIQKLAAYGWHFHRLLSLSIVGCALCVYVYMRISPFSMISRGSSVVVFSAEGGSEKFAGSQLCTVWECQVESGVRFALRMRLNILYEIWMCVEWFFKRCETRITGNFK